MKGTTLIEVLIALAVASIVIAGVTIVSITALSNAQYVRSSDQATKYAQEGMEVVRSIRNADYPGFRSYNGTFCLGGNEKTFGLPQSTCTVPNVGSFIRSVELEQSSCGVDVARVTVVVAWTDGRCDGGSYCHRSDLVSCLSTVSLN